MSNNKLGLYLKTLRKSSNYTQEYVASYLNVIRQSYSHYETGRTTPNLEVLHKLAKLYHIPLDALLELQLDFDASEKNNTVLSAVSFPATHSEFCISGNLSISELQLLTAFRKLALQDQQDILDFVNIKARRK